MKLGFFLSCPGCMEVLCHTQPPLTPAQFSKVHLHPQGTTQPGLCLEMIKM